MDATLAGCERPVAEADFAEIAWSMGSLPSPLRLVRYVHGGDPHRVLGTETHQVPLESCQDCAARRADPHYGLMPDWAKYVQHPLPGEDWRAFEDRIRPRGKSDYYWYGSKSGFVTDLGRMGVRYPVQGKFGTKEPNLIRSTGFVYSPSGFGDGGARFPEDFGRRPGLVESGDYPRHPRLVGLSWERYDALGCSNLELGGRLFANGELKRPGFFERELDPYMDALAAHLPSIASQARPALAWCGETPHSQILALRIAKKRDFWFVNWINVYGPAYVQRLGRDFLLGAPGFKTQELEDGSITYQVTKAFSPQAATSPTPEEVETYFRSSSGLGRVVYRPWLKNCLGHGGRSRDDAGESAEK